MVPYRELIDKIEMEFSCRLERLDSGDPSDTSKVLINNVLFRNNL
jgi:hypothetical protein